MVGSCPVQLIESDAFECSFALFLEEGDLLLKYLEKVFKPIMFSFKKIKIKKLLLLLFMGA